MVSKDVVESALQSVYGRCFGTGTPAGVMPWLIDEDEGLADRSFLQFGVLDSYVLDVQLMMSKGPRSSAGKDSGGIESEVCFSSTKILTVPLKTLGNWILGWAIILGKNPSRLGRQATSKEPLQDPDDEEPIRRFRFAFNCDKGESINVRIQEEEFSMVHSSTHGVGVKRSTISLDKNGDLLVATESKPRCLLCNTANRPCHCNDMLYFSQNHADAFTLLRPTWGCTLERLRGIALTNENALKWQKNDLIINRQFIGIAESVKYYLPGHPEVEACRRLFATYWLGSGPSTDHRLISSYPEGETEFLVPRTQIVGRDVVSREITRADGEVPYRRPRALCEYCGRTFSRRTYLKSHISKDHESGAALYTCKTCLTTFISRTNLNRHERMVHQGIQRHFCSECDYGFFNRFDFERHVQNRHGKRGQEQLHSLT
uniref:C2H2-type domain-containing protein n=1 Tax=Compsopogon caeruleus TaxID=31354 RepID=A0A7S1TDN5_9RHOD|mmetsp:Transcript_243/g.413  ORF Transcript_243/g.413 Transcript_243/m.413 type:complete len:430 (+) Transcript_243:46-1335(+)